MTPRLYSFILSVYKGWNNKVDAFGLFGRHYFNYTHVTGS